MGNRKRGYKPNSKTRQKRAAALREWELENPEDDVESADTAPPRGRSTADADPRPRTGLARLFSVQRRPATPAERDDTPWSRRGLLTLALIAAVVAIPLGTVAYYGEQPSNGNAHHSYALWIVASFGPAQSIPLFNVGLSCLVAMPLARALAREQRSLRILEVLGFAAVVQILIYILWSPITSVSGWDYNGAAIAGGGIADLTALACSVLLYPRVTRWLMRRARPKR